MTHHLEDQELKLEEIESSHTLGGVGEGDVQGRGKWSLGEGEHVTLMSYTLYPRMEHPRFMVPKSSTPRDITTGE